MFRLSPLRRLVPLVLCAAVLSAFATSHDDRSIITGTWKWVALDGHRVHQPLYIRYDMSGTATTWPSPEGWSDSHGISRAFFAVQDDHLILRTSQHPYGSRSQLEFHHDTCDLITETGHRLTYMRMEKPPEPGYLEDQTPAGFLPNTR